MEMAAEGGGRGNQTDLAENWYNCSLDHSEQLSNGAEQDPMTGLTVTKAPFLHGSNFRTRRIWLKICRVALLTILNNFLMGVKKIL